MTLKMHGENLRLKHIVVITKVIVLFLITTRIFNHCIVSRVAAIHNSLLSSAV